MKDIDFGKVKVLLDDYAIQGNAILGIRESGKSYTATYAGERLMDAGIPITAVDPIGVWHSLRIPAQGAGYPVVVVGGQHADLPLTPASAEATMRAAMAAGVSIVFDLYDVKLSKKDWRDIVVAIVKVLLFENKAHGLRHVFIEEAPEFVPQKVLPDQGLVYSFIERLVRMGGNAQLGVTLIGQRAEEMNKAVLELCDCLVLHRQKGRRSLENLSKWLELASPATAKEVAADVPILKNGQAFVWPRGVDAPVRTQIPEKRTFHPDRRTRHKATAAEAQRMDAGEFVERMKSELARVKAAPLAEVPRTTELVRGVSNDETVQALRAQVKSEYDRGFAEGERKGRLDGYNFAMAEAKKFASSIQETINSLTQVHAALDGNLVPPPQGASGATWGTSVVQQTAEAQKKVNGQARRIAKIAGCPFDKPERLILSTLRQYHPEPLGRTRVALLTRYSSSGGGFKNALGRLRAKDLITKGEPLELTPAGAAAIEPYYEPLPGGRDLIEHWKRSLDKPGRLILQALVDVYPEALTRTQLANRAGYEADGGGFKNALGRMRTLALIKGQRDIKAAEVFFQ